MSIRIRHGRAVFTDLQETDDFLLEVSYNKYFITRMKDVVDSAYREWDSARQAWIIDYDYFLPVMTLVAEYFVEIVVRDPHDKYVYRTTMPMMEETT